MLVLGREPRERIFIDHAGERLEVTYLGQHHGSTARIGFHGPQSFAIKRVEADGAVVEPKQGGAA